MYDVLLPAAVFSCLYRPFTPFAADLPYTKTSSLHATGVGAGVGTGVGAGDGGPGVGAVVGESDGAFVGALVGGFGGLLTLTLRRVRLRQAGLAPLLQVLASKNPLTELDLSANALGDQVSSWPSVSNRDTKKSFN